MIKFRLFGLFLALAALTGCSKKEASPPGAKMSVMMEDPEFLRVGTASLGGNYFPMGAAIAGVIDDGVEGHRGSVQSTGGSSYNLSAMEKGDLELALAQGTAVAQAVKGVDAFENRAVQEVNTLLVYNATPQHIILNNKHEGSAFADLKGKKMEVISAGDGIEVSTKKILKALGYRDDFVKLEYSGNRVQAASRLKTGQVDGIIDATGIGSSWITDVVGKGRFQFLPLSSEEVTTLTQAYFEFSPSKIPAGTYNGQDADIPTVSNWTVIIVKKSLSEELVYKVTKALFENKKTLLEKHNYFKDVAPDNITGAGIAPVHPGAMKYYKEMGIQP